MRKILYAFLVALCGLFLFSGCNSAGKIPRDINLNFSATVSMQGESELIGGLEYTSNKCMIFTVKSPKNIEGFTVKWQDEAYSVNYRDLSYEYTSSFLPNEAYPNCLKNALSVMDNMENLTVEENKDGFTSFSGKCRCGKFTAAVENETETISSISFSEKSLTIDFISIKPYESNEENIKTNL